MPVGGAHEALYRALLVNTLYQSHAPLIVLSDDSRKRMHLGEFVPIVMSTRVFCYETSYVMAPAVRLR